MTRIYQYTSGISAGLPFGTLIPQPLTRAALYVPIYDAFVAAGWTPSPVDLGVGGDNRWSSTGESGSERLYARTEFVGPATFKFYVGTKLDGAGNLQGSIGGGTALHEAWTLGADGAFDLTFFGSKDFMWCVARLVADESTTSFYVGILEREAIVNPNTLVTTGVVLAGAHVAIPVSGDPHTFGFRVGEWVQIIEQATGSAAAAETRAIVGLTATEIVVDSLSVGYASGALIGSMPMPIARFVGSGNNPDELTQWYSPFLTTRGVSDLGEQIFTAVDFATGTNYDDNLFLVTSAGAANVRVLRYGCRTIQIGHSLAGAQWGRVSGLVAYPRTALNLLVFYLADTGTYDRVDTTVAGLSAVGDTIGFVGGSTYSLNIAAGPFGSVVVGEYVKIWDALSGANNGTFPITSVAGAPGTIEYTNATPGVAEAFVAKGFRVAPVQRFIAARFENVVASTTKAWMFGRMP